MIQRKMGKRILEALTDTPVVMVQGPRQCGKSTLVREVAPHLPYVSLDDPAALDFAHRNPRAFLRAHPQGLILDEVQRAPDIFRSLKAEVDEDRRPGRFLLTGSSSLLLLPKLSESLAGRMEVASLWPLSRCEVKDADGSFIDRAFACDFSLTKGEALDWSILTKGGFPEPFHRANDSRRRAWFEAYVKALIERDVRSLSDIEGLTALPRILKLLARSVGETLNVSSLSRESGVPHTTLQRYLGLLEAVFLIHPLSAWTSGLSHRTLKAQRVAFVDSGLLIHLLGIDPSALSPDEPLVSGVLSSWAAMELMKQASWSDSPPEVVHFRSVRQYEVPIVLVRPDGQIVAVDVTPDAYPSPTGLRALEFLEQVAEGRLSSGILLTAGSEARRLSERLWALPYSSLWS